MKKGFYFVLMLCAACVVASCSKTKSYADMLKDEEKAIDWLLDTLQIEVLKDFPADTVFKENQFVKLEDDVYLNIIDRGSDDRAVLGKTKIMYRCSAYYLVGGYAQFLSNYGPNSNGTVPYPCNPYNTAETEPFIYGEVSSSETGSSSYLFVSEGLQIPLQYVGHRGKVKLIVPFDKGTYLDQGTGDPIYYEIVEYLFEDKL